MRLFLLCFLGFFPFVPVISQERQTDVNQEPWYRHLSINPNVVVSAQKPFLNGGNVIAGYRVFPGFSAGIGAGFLRLEEMSTYDTVEANFSLLPVFAEFRYAFLKTDLTPFLAVQGGYNFLINQPSSEEGYKYIPIYPPYAWADVYNYDAYNRGGFYFDAGAGVKYRLSEVIGLTASLNYSLLQVHGTHHQGTYQYLPDENGGTRQIVSFSEWEVMAYMHLFSLRLGVEIF